MLVTRNETNENVNTNKPGPKQKKGSGLNFSTRIKPLQNKNSDIYKQFSIVEPKRTSKVEPTALTHHEMVKDTEQDGVILF